MPPKQRSAVTTPVTTGQNTVREDAAHSDNDAGLGDDPEIMADNNDSIVEAEDSSSALATLNEFRLRYSVLEFVLRECNEPERSTRLEEGLQGLARESGFAAQRIARPDNHAQTMRTLRQSSADSKEEVKAHILDAVFAPLTSSIDLIRAKCVEEVTAMAMQVRWLEETMDAAVRQLAPSMKVQDADAAAKAEKKRLSLQKYTEERKQLAEAKKAKNAAHRLKMQVVRSAEREAAEAAKRKKLRVEK